MLLFRVINKIASWNPKCVKHSPHWSPSAAPVGAIQIWLQWNKLGSIPLDKFFKPFKV